jgi:hypothetical protein
MNRLVPSENGNWILQICRGLPTPLKFIRGLLIPSLNWEGSIDESLGREGIENVLKNLQEGCPIGIKKKTILNTISKV